MTVTEQNKNSSTASIIYQLLQNYHKSDNDALCPQCRNLMYGLTRRQLLSRRVNVYICSQCGLLEALEDAGLLQETLPLYEWAYVKDCRSKEESSRENVSESVRLDQWQI